MYKRPIYQLIIKRLLEPRRFIQVLAGPRQTGKTTLARQAIAELSDRFITHYASADEPALKDRVWIEQQWEMVQARLLSGEKSSSQGLLVFDEIQKIPEWSETVKYLWERDSALKVPLRILLLGSSTLLMQQGLTESLAGRFELLRVTHWSFVEMHAAFDWSLDQYIFFGGYPGAAPLIEDPNRWSRYILDSLVETTLSRDVFLIKRVDKPALLRRLFELGCTYSGQILSYQKMLGQLQDAGNTTTLAHYLKLLQNAGLLVGISKYAGERVRQRASSPKLLALNTALLSAHSHLTFEQARKDPEFWGRIAESAIGAHLANAIQGTKMELFYWQNRNLEVDFVLRYGNVLTAIEIKSTRRPAKLPGLVAFSKEFPSAKKLLVGGQGIPLQEFLESSPQKWLTS
jgi:predicted AAA+ superfamily ATPase